MKQNLEALLGVGRVQEGVDLFPFLSMRIHTKAQYFFEAKTKTDLLNALKITSQLQIPLILLGGGSNTLFQLSTVVGLVVKNSFAQMDVNDEGEWGYIEVGSGMNMGVFIQKLVNLGYAGLEYQKGLPGSVGGGVYMNSKWTHPVSYVGDHLHSALISDSKGNVKNVLRDYFSFSYDYSILQDTHEYLITSTFRLKKLDSSILKERARQAQEYRQKTQPSGKPTCGCFFRNITDEEQTIHKLPTKSAGYLIDKSGMKGVTRGSFAVSEIHANFIVNNGGDARPEDLMALSKLVKERVKIQFGIELQEEVEIK